MNATARPRFSIAGALVGLVVGILAVALASAGLWVAGVISVGRPKPVNLTIQSLPEKVLGYDRYDRELKAQPASDKATTLLKAVADAEAAKKPIYVQTYGGEGVDISYGLLSSQVQLTVTAVNGDLNLPVAATPEMVDYVSAISGYQPISVKGTARSQCVYLVSVGVPLNGQPAAQVIDDVVSTRRFDGTVECVRRSIERNLSVMVLYTPGTTVEPDATAVTVAAAVAAETDRIWTSLA